MDIVTKMFKDSGNKIVRAAGIAIEQGARHAKSSGFVEEKLTEFVLEQSRMFKPDSVRTITNRSNQGVDSIGKPAWGQEMDVWMGFEVKTSEGGTFKMSDPQRQGGHSFVKSRVDAITTGRGVYGRGVSNDLKSFAMQVRAEMKGKTYAAYAILNGYINTPNPATEIQAWNSMTGNPRFLKPR